jgi:hypothetical protein
MYIKEIKKRFIQSLILAFIPLGLFFCLNRIVSQASPNQVSNQAIGNQATSTEVN